MNRAPAPKSDFALPYYGWFVLAASAVSEMLAIGATSYSAGLFVLPLQAEFGLSRADASSSVLIIFLGAVFFASPVGRVLDRYPIRLVICAGAAVFAGAFAAIALTSALWLIALLLMLPAALGFMILGPMTTSTLTSRWFFKRRGLALGIAAIATSGGGLLVVPFLSMAIQLYGWRHALLLEAGVIFLVITTLALLILKDNPFRAGLGEHPENNGRTDGTLFMHGPENADTAAETWPWRKILSSRGFWAPSLLIAAGSGLSQAITVSAPPYGSELGFPAMSAALLISAFSVAAALTKIFAGIMADHWDKRALLFGSALCMSLSLAILCFFTGYWEIFAAFCIAGISLGGVLPTSASLIAARFGAARFGSVMGWSWTLITSFTILIVRFSGWVFDSTRTYPATFAALLIISVVVSAIALAIDYRLRPDQP
jgi:MFS family permease